MSNALPGEVIRASKTGFAGAVSKSTITDFGRIFIVMLINISLIISIYSIMMSVDSKELNKLPGVDGNGRTVAGIIFGVSVSIQILSIIMLVLFGLYRSEGPLDYLKSFAHIAATIYLSISFIWTIELPTNTFDNARVILIILTLGGLGLNIFSLITKIPQALSEIIKTDALADKPAVPLSLANCNCPTTQVPVGPTYNYAIDKVIGGNLEGDTVDVESVRGSRAGGDLQTLGSLKSLTG